MMLLPPKNGVCPVCAVDHPPEYPHDATSLYYQYRFYERRGRWPTWADAAAHCTAQMKALWREGVEKRGHKWTEPEDGQPIADPPAESIRQPVGSLNTPTLREES